MIESKDYINNKNELYDDILQILCKHFPQYSDYKLSKISKDICDIFD